MPRRWLSRVFPSSHSLMERWPLRVFHGRLAEPKLWTLTRRGVCAGVGAGLSICFVPLPVHTLLAVLVGLTWRINIPAIFATTLLMNPLTMVPMFYAAYRVGALVVGVPVGHHFGFRLDWDWLQHGLGPVWKPFLVGCLTCSVTLGISGWLGLGFLWRWHVLHQRRRGMRARTCPDRPDGQASL